MTFAKAFGGTLIAFLVIDIVWIVRLARPMYDQQIGSLLRTNPQFGAAALFYLTYAAGIVYLAVLPALASGGGVRTALVNGAILGGLAYGTYAFTSYAMLKGWPFGLAASDVAWGMVLTAVSSVCGLLAARVGG